MTFFTNGIFTLDGATATLMFTLSNILIYSLMFTFPQTWITHFSFVVYLIIYIIALFAIIRRNKPILNVCFWINTVLFALFSLWCIFAIPSYLYNQNSLAYLIENWGFAANHVLTTYIAHMMPYYIVHQVAIWFSHFIYLCALNAARAECVKVSVAINMTGPTMRV